MTAETSEEEDLDGDRRILRQLHHLQRKVTAIGAACSRSKSFFAETEDNNGIDALNSVVQEIESYVENSAISDQ